MVDLSIPELNVVKKDWRRVDLKVALCYPNIYRAGMTGLTVRLLYALFNLREDVLCERFFIPTFREPLTSIESRQPINKFDVAAFTLQYEEDYPNVIRMLIESNIPPRREDRTAEDPIIIAGGPCATANPEPLADYIDLFVIGEVEVIINQLIDSIKDVKDRGSRTQLRDLTSVDGAYIPEESNPAERVWVRSLDDAPHPVAQQIPLVDPGSPYMTAFGGAFSLEVSRGCSRGCRFCMMGSIGRPRRDRTLNKIEAILDDGITYTPVEKVALIGASVFDHPNLEEICEYVTSKGLGLSIPSIRPEAVTERLARLLVEGGQRGVTMAPDGASPRMQMITNKRMDEDSIIEAARTLLDGGLRRLKLYYMIGLPQERPEDIEYIIQLSRRIAELGYGPRSIHISINPLIPKPQTPFQWEGLAPTPYLRKAIRLIRSGLMRDGRFIVDVLDLRHARIQTLLSRGDRRIGRVIEHVARLGGGLGAWRRALREFGVKMEDYIGSRVVGEPNPWDHINIGLNRSFLIDEVRRYAEYGAR